MNKQGLEDLGWEPDFWLYLMVYCFILSLLSGVVHEMVITKFGYSRDTALLEIDLAQLHSDSNKPVHRRTTY